MRKLAISALVIAGLSFILGIIARMMGSMPAPFIEDGVAGMTFLKIAKLFVLSAIAFALLEKK
ncbi:MAG: hypothetical protein JSW17_01280 [Candidatus Omnitrophota bacterium]|nr:MAG: hypothetical protein JSW17_01280 [Candidatus Omnitrophota bacterium]